MNTNTQALREAFDKWWLTGSYGKRPMDLLDEFITEDQAFGIWEAALSQPPAPEQAGGEQPNISELAQYPDKCPITRRPFFMVLHHPELGRVPTYGGPFDSYTIPHMEGEPHEPMHERELSYYRYDHDAGSWVDGVEAIPLRVIHEDVLNEYFELKEAAATPTAEPAVEAMKCSCAECGKTGTKDSMWALYCLDCVQKHGIGSLPWIELVRELCPDDLDMACDECGGQESDCPESCTYRKARAMLSASPAAHEQGDTHHWPQQGETSWHAAPEDAPLSSFAASPAAPEAAKPGQQAQAGEPQK